MGFFDDEDDDMGEYAWIIDVDHLTDDPSNDSFRVTGPGRAPVEMLTRLDRGQGRKFRMLDDDGIVYYSGRIITDIPAGTETDFGPLWDFGTPNAGAVDIQYWDKGWKSL